jgi:hypothetical protein
MKNEGWFVLSITVIAAVSLSFCSAETSAFVAVFSFLTGFTFLIGVVLWSGIQLRLHAGAHKSKLKELIFDHRFFIACMTTFTLVGVVGIEIAVRKSGGLLGEPALLMFHFSLVLGMVSCFVQARFYTTGLRNPRVHRMAAYGFILFYLGAFVTGTILVENRFSLRTYAAPVSN